VEIDARPRRGGKTTALLNWMLDGHADEARVLVVPSRAHFDLVEESLRALRENGATGPGSWEIFIAGDNLRERLAGRFPGKKRIVLALDELDAVLERLLGHPVRVATLTPTSMLERVYAEGTTRTLMPRK